MLWGEAYKSEPAGSLPDDDDELAEAAGFAMDDVAAFLAAKAEIMRPWTLCSDGRWYHPVVCEVVLDAWGRISEKRQAERTKKAAQRQRLRLQRIGLVAPVPQTSGGVPIEPSGVPPSSRLVPRDIDEALGDRATQTGKDTRRQSIDDADVAATATNLGPMHWKARLDEARALAGDALDPIAGGLFSYVALKPLCEPISGTPCEWSDVLEAVRHVSANFIRRGEKMSSWAIVCKEAVKIRDRRLASSHLPPVNLNEGVGHDRPAGGDKLARKLANMERAARGAALAAQDG